MYAILQCWVRGAKYSWKQEDKFLTVTLNGFFGIHTFQFPRMTHED